MVEGFPPVILLRVTFEEYDGKTKMTIQQSYPSAIARRQGAYAGWDSSLDKLAAYVERAS